MNSTKHAFKKSQASVAKRTLLGSALIGFRSNVLVDSILWFQEVGASLISVVCQRTSQQLTSNQSSLRSKLLRGTAASRRPLAWRYEYMRFLALTVLFLNPVIAMAWECGDPTDRHDLVAYIKIEKENEKYIAAFDATIERIIYRYGEQEASFNESNLGKLKVGSSIIVLESKLEEKQPESSVKNFKLIRTDSCMKSYKIGDKVRLFSKEVLPNVYRSSSSWTKNIK